jgi:DNA-binding beta-propeller fold protein YncE
MRLSLGLICAGAAAAGVTPTQPPAAAPLSYVRSIPLPRVEGRIDHLAIDLGRQRLFVAALGNNSVEVVDLQRGTRARSLPGFAEPQGVAVAPDTSIVAVANRRSADVRLLDGQTLSVAHKVRLGDDPDNVRYDSSRRRFYVGYASGAIAALDSYTGEQLGEATLTGHPESFQLERSTSRIFVNVPDSKQIAIVDRDAMNVTSTWPVVEAAANYPMALDETGHRLFVGCRRPAKLLMYDTERGDVITSADMVGDADDLFYESSRRRVYVVGGEGFVDVFLARDPKTLTRIGRIATAAGARTALFVPEQGRLYVAVPHRGTQRAEIRVYEAR